MRVAQIVDGRVLVVHENDPREYGGCSSMRGDVSLVDVTNIEGIDIGWFARRVAGQWVFAATHDELETASTTAGS